MYIVKVTLQDPPGADIVGDTDSTRMSSYAYHNNLDVTYTLLF